MIPILGATAMSKDISICKPKIRLLKNYKSILGRDTI
jgi:hypothetical protein